MKKINWHRIGKISGWIVGSLIGLIILLLFALYLPFVQDFALKKVLGIVNSGGEMEMSVDRFRLRFPLKFEVDSFKIVDRGEPMLSVGNLRGEVALLPLLKGEVLLDEADVADVKYAMGNSDSLMILRAAVNEFSIHNSSIALSSMDIDIDDAELDGAKVSIVMKEDTASVEKSDTTAVTPLKINARKLTLRNIDYAMSMEGLIDTLTADVKFATLADGFFDLQGAEIRAREAKLDSVTAAYFYPAVESKTDPEVSSKTDTATVASLPFTVNVEKISLLNGEGIYALTGAEPLPGLDMNYLQVNNIEIQVDSFYNRGVEIRIPLKKLSATERCGIDLVADGCFSMDSSEMKAERFSISTGFSKINFDALMGMGDFAKNPSLPVMLKAEATIAPIDVKRALPAMSPMIDKLPSYCEVIADADVSGSIGDISINNLGMELTRVIKLRASGNASNIMDFENADCLIDFDGSLTGGDVVKRTFFDPQLSKTVNIPPLSLSGQASMFRGTATATLRALTEGGKVAFDGGWNGKYKKYNADLSFNEFPVQAIMPGLGVKDLTAHAKIDGQGYDPFSPAMNVDANIDLKKVVFNGHLLSDISLTANLHDGKADVILNSTNPAVDIDLKANGNLAPLPYNWILEGNINNIDLMALGLSKEKMRFAADFKGNASLNPGTKEISAELGVSKLVAQIDPSVNMVTTDLNLSLSATDSSTEAQIANHQLKAIFNSPCPVDSLGVKFIAAMDSLNRGLARQQADIAGLQSALPEFDLRLSAGRRNVINDFLKGNKISFDTINAVVKNDSTINFSAYLREVNIGSTRLDTISLTGRQIGRYLTFEGSVDNAPGTFDQLAHLNLHGYLVDHKAGVFFRQTNIDGKIGFRIGGVADIADSVVTFNFVPYNPIIGYKQWTINRDNFISFDIPEKHIDANLMMKNDESSLHLFTQHVDTLHEQEDIVLNISDVKIADWVSINPFAPPMKGDLSAKIRVGQREDKMLNGKAVISLANFTYGRKRVGSFEVDADVITNAKGFLSATAGLSVDSVKVMTAYGHLNDTTSAEPFLLDVELIRFPLSIANPFLPPRTASLAGVLNGQMDVTGSINDPKFNGYIEFDSTSLYLNMLATSFKFSQTLIPVDSNVVSFRDFTIKGVNENPLAVNGIINMRDLTDPAINLHLTAENMQIVGSNRVRRGADIYGKAFIDLDTKAKGKMSDLNINAALTVLSGTNVTYVISDAQAALQSRSTGDMVKFVNFADTTSLASSDSIVQSGTSLNLNAELIIEPGSAINVDLSTDGKNKVSIQGNGDLDFSMSPMNDGRLTGRYNITGGFARYTPPFMSEKLFNFQEGSYVAFNGEMMNPILNIHAVDNLKANVTQTGQNSRLITFNVLLGVTGTLEQMDVKFDLTTNDDITIQNELQSMSADQRANQAMNLLLYNVYTGPGTKANSNIGGNALYSFLESQLNSWAANNIKGVDLSFGINQYDQTMNGSTSTATSYSYKVSKTMFNDRFKIVVGGNYTNDADPDQNVAEDLINDISFEYLLNKNGTMLIRIFRHTGFESILEGEITQTGVGFVYKRKIQRIADMFKPFSKKSKIPVLPQDGQVLTPEVQVSNEDEKNRE